MAFADRPYRTFDAIPTADFFAYRLVQDFFGGMAGLILPASFYFPRFLFSIARLGR
jgi:hypothetical protein